MKRQKIAFLIPSLQAGGAERVVVTLANSLVNNFEVSIITFYNNPIFYDLNEAISINYCLEEYKAISSFKHSFMNNIKLFKHIYKIVKSQEIDLIVGFMTTPNIYAILVAKILQIPCIISERVHPEHYLIPRFWNIIRKLVYPFTNILVVQTQDIASFFSKFVNKNKIRIILNPLNPNLIDKKNKLLIKKNIILNVGRLDYQKNQDMLIKAFYNLKPKNWKLVIIGDGMNMDNYRNLIQELKLEDTVELVGQIKDVSSYYNQSKIFALTSRFEGFPNALTEAMYFGLGVISTNCPSGPSEIIKDSENGFLIPVEDQNMLEEKLNFLINNPQTLNEIGKKAESDTDGFSAEQIALQWKNLIIKLLN